MKIGSRRILTMQDFQKLQDECTSGPVWLPLRVHLDDESGFQWVTTAGVLTIILSLWLLRELSPNKLQWLLRWISSAKFLGFRLDQISSHGLHLYPLLPLPWNHLTWQETIILN